MRCNFVVGQKVVAAFDRPWVNNTTFEPSDGPKMGEIYTIRKLHKHIEGIYLEFLDWPVPNDIFLHWRFRPLEERKTDISVFTALLNPVKQREDA